MATSPSESVGTWLGARAALGLELGLGLGLG